jgi:hypothetical protein
MSISVDEWLNSLVSMRSAQSASNYSFFACPPSCPPKLAHHWWAGEGGSRPTADNAAAGVFLISHFRDNLLVFLAVQ